MLRRYLKKKDLMCHKKGGIGEFVKLYKEEASKFQEHSLRIELPTTVSLLDHCWKDNGRVDRSGLMAEKISWYLDIEIF